MGKYLVIISKYLARLVTNSNFEAMANSNSEKKETLHGVQESKTGKGFLNDNILKKPE